MPGQTAVTPILYQNPSRTLTLLDIPTSMSLAQGTTDHPCADQIYASPPLKTPYPSTEPKSDKARAKVRQQNLLIEDGTNISDALLLQRLAEMKEQWHSKGEWCLPRKVSPFVVKRHGEKRKVNKLEGEEASIHTPGSVLPFDMNVDGNTLAPILNVEPNLEIPGSDVRVLRMDQPLILSSSSTPKTYTCSNIRQVINTLVHNPYATRLSLCLSDTNYTIPPGASFLLSKINEDTSPALSIAALTMYPDASESAGPGQFNFVLLDPPWQNRSVRRSASYDIRHSAGPMGVIRDVLEQHIAPGALVACWVTNNARSRELAREAFQVWDVDLLEEWVWLKTTDGGAPITAIGGLWRKPYEVLLLGRKRKDDQSQTLKTNIQVKVMIAVPDLHSRKPHLKTLIEPYMPVNYRALEVFARVLTAGWWAWGDQVLKFNWDGHWSHQ